MGPRTRSETELETTHFEALVWAEAEGDAAPGELESLQAAPGEWEETLRRLLSEIETALMGARRISGGEREQVLADLSGDRQRLTTALRRVTGSGGDDERSGPDDERRGAANTSGAGGGAGDDDHGEPVVQASWASGQVVLWAGAAGAAAVGDDELRRLLGDAGAATTGWESHRGVPLPSGARAAAVAAPLSGALGWLVGAGTGHLAGDAAPSVRWLGEVAAWATELVAQGRMVPTLVRSRSKGRGDDGSQATNRYTASWAPAVLDSQRLQRLSGQMPGAVIALDPSARPDRVCRAVLAAAVDAVCRAGAARLVAPAAAPLARTFADVSEAFLASLDGSAFAAATRAATDVSDELARWAAPVLAHRSVGLTIRLQPPGPEGGWLLTVEVDGVDRQPMPVDQALTAASRAKGREVEAELARLERLLPALRRQRGGTGKVVLDAGEAWELMSTIGFALTAAGFEVRVPSASPRRSSPTLRLSAEAFNQPSQVGAHQLSRVRWSVLFDDVELGADDISRLAAQARPLLRVKGRWVELDRADIDAAAAALGERAGTTELSGAAILRHAVGLEGGSLGGPVVVDGSGWAVELVKGVTASPPQPLEAPEGFVGTLRSYQADARGWLAFLDRAGLGGCLAMDMGLGKTPTVLAHVLETRAEGPSLVVVPPAVLGNWKHEASRFTPELGVHVHHGADRATGDLAGIAAGVDIVLTTYATAVRDVEGLAAISWRRLVIDEAQTIKNPASETAQQLRRIPAGGRLALTGTPIENGLGDLWSILDFTNPGLVGARAAFVEQLSKNGTGGVKAAGETALRALNGLLVFRRTKSEPEIAAELPDKIDELNHCGMTPEQIGLYQAVLDRLLAAGPGDTTTARKGQVLAAITALKQICDHPAAYVDDDRQGLAGRSGKLTRLEELVDAVFAADERILVFTHFARWGERLAVHLAERTGIPIACYHGGLSRPVRDRLVEEFQKGTGAGALVLSIKAGGAGLNLTAANHVVLYDRWWNPAVEDQARDRAWRIGQNKAVVSHRLVCPGTVDERVEEVVAGKRRIADVVLPASSSLGDLGADELRAALGLRSDALIDESSDGGPAGEEETAA